MNVLFRNCLWARQLDMAVELSLTFGQCAKITSDHFQSFEHVADLIFTSWNPLTPQLLLRVESCNTCVAPDAGCVSPTNLCALVAWPRLLHGQRRNRLCRKSCPHHHMLSKLLSRLLSRYSGKVQQPPVAAGICRQVEPQTTLKPRGRRWNVMGVRHRTAKAMLSSGRYRRLPNS